MKKLVFGKKQKYTGILPDLTKYGFIELNREQLYEVNGRKDKSKGSKKKSGDKKTGESVSGMLSDPQQNATTVITVSVDEKSLGGQNLTDSGIQSGTNVGTGNSENTAIVKKGDTLSQIVYEYNKTNGTNLTVGEVAKNSGIENPDLIHPGEEIKFLIGESSVSVAQEKSDISELQLSDRVGTVIDSSRVGIGTSIVIETTGDYESVTSDVKGQFILNRTDSDVNNNPDGKNEMREIGIVVDNEGAMGNGHCGIFVQTDKGYSYFEVNGMDSDEKVGTKIKEAEEKGSYNPQKKIYSTEETYDYAEILSHSDIRGLNGFLADVSKKDPAAGASRRDFKTKEQMLRYLKTAGPNNGFDVIYETNVTISQSKTIYDNAIMFGESFSDYRIVGNSCLTYVDNILSAGDTGIADVNIFDYTHTFLNQKYADPITYLGIHALNANAPNDYAQAFGYYNNAQVYRLRP